MDSSYQRSQHRQRSRDPLERRMDQWFETGRQFVDGVAGNRPGQRRSSGRPITSGLDNVGRWVGDKIDWFLEEEEDWVEPFQDYAEEPTVSYPTKKRPLEAISLRGTKSLQPSYKHENISDQEDEDTWPDQSSFKVDRWERKAVNALEDPISHLTSEVQPTFETKRPLPRSSRRKN